ncbi:MarR family transcriptional regulator (plasmid) [Haloplanus ruber]|uniref:MarR family transcriptional regulator n=1 Tax=Haloplanus ruber TaxID=869892 RepID=A0ABD6D1Q1_9EURY|nr:MarR family transcriptional regulator [Haloplanus ruber]
MPVHVDEFTNGEPFPVKPDTNEYEALRFLVANREYGFTPSEIADKTDISDSSITKTMTRLFEKDLVARSAGVYYVPPEGADTIKQRLESLDATVQLFESTPDDDAYSKDGWEDEVPSLEASEQESTSSSESGKSVED